MNDQEDYRNKRKREEIQSPQPQKKIKLESGSAAKVTTSATTSSSNTATSIESKASASKLQLLSALNNCSAYFTDDSHFFLAIEIIQALELPHDMPIDGDEFKTYLLTALLQDDLYSSNQGTLGSMATLYSTSKNAFDMDIEGAVLLTTFFSQFAKVMSELSAYASKDTSL